MLSEIFVTAMMIGKKAPSKRPETASGLNDNFWEFFMDQSFRLQATLIGVLAADLGVQL